MTSSNQQEITKCTQTLLHGELSAIETYDQVIEDFRGEEEELILRELRDDHVRSRQSLQRHMFDLGIRSEKSSGAWGSWAQFATGTAKIFGRTAALRALIEGEEHGMKDYIAAEAQSSMNPVLHDEIHRSFIPKQRWHIEQLTKLMKMQ